VPFLCHARGQNGCDLPLPRSTLEAPVPRRAAVSSNKERDPLGASRAMREYLATLDDTAFGAAVRALQLLRKTPVRASLPAS
jgi:hypothetical protein